jgi:hypothetical protein
MLGELMLIRDPYGDIRAASLRVYRDGHEYIENPAKLRKLASWCRRAANWMEGHRG